MNVYFEKIKPVLAWVRTLVPLRTRWWWNLAGLDPETLLGAWAAGILTIAALIYWPGAFLAQINSVGMWGAFVLSALVLGAPCLVLSLIGVVDTKTSRIAASGWGGLLAGSIFWGYIAENNGALLGWLIASLAAVFFLSGVAMIVMVIEAEIDRRQVANGWPKIDEWDGWGAEDQKGKWAAGLVEGLLVRGKIEEAKKLIKEGDARGWTGWRADTWREAGWETQAQRWMRSFWVGSLWRARLFGGQIVLGAEGESIVGGLVALGGGRGVWTLVQRDFGLLDLTTQKMLLKKILCSPDKEERLAVARQMASSGLRLESRDSSKATSEQSE